jgi:cytoskeleton protein RodZ
MPTVAEQLRAAREAANLSLHQVAEATKLKVEQIEALESATYDCFPAPVYIRGSIRTYGKLLHLDVPKLMAQLDTEFASSKELSGPPPLTQPAGGALDWVMLQLSRLDWRILAGLGLLVVALIIAWSLLGPSSRSRKPDPLSNLGPGLYTPRQAHQGEVINLPTNPPGR